MEEFEKSLEEFCDKYIIEEATLFDKNEEISKNLIHKLFELGYFQGIAGSKFGFQDWNNEQIGIANKIVGKYSPALRTFLTVQGMCILSIKKWGSKKQKEKYINNLARGDYLCSFALSESEAGSDACNIQSTAIDFDENYYEVNGEKQWISFASLSDGFLTFVKIDNKPTCILIDRNTEGITIDYFKNTSANRGTGMAQLTFNKCLVPKENIIGGIGSGINIVALFALDFGRYTVAWGALGIAERCLELAIKHTLTRKQFEKSLNDHDLIKKILTEMIVSVKNMELLSVSTARKRDKSDLNYMFESWCVKYFNTITCTQVSDKAIKLFGANGLFYDSEINRLNRESKILEIIEGTTQIHELTIATEYIRNNYQGRF